MNSFLKYLCIAGAVFAALLVAGITNNIVRSGTYENVLAQPKFFPLFLGTIAALLAIICLALAYVLHVLNRIK
jgi:hypothetical protein